MDAPWIIPLGLHLSSNLTPLGILAGWPESISSLPHPVNTGAPVCQPCCSNTPPGNRGVGKTVECCVGNPFITSPEHHPSPVHHRLQHLIHKDGLDRKMVVDGWGGLSHGANTLAPISLMPNSQVRSNGSRSEFIWLSQFVNTSA